MSLRTPIFLVLVLALFGFASSVPAGAEETPDSDPILAKLDESFAATQLDLPASAVVYGVVADGKLLHTGTFGVRNISSGEPARSDTNFRIASMTKMMTALLVLDLHDQGRLALDAPAESYEESLRSLAYPTTDSRKITVRDLLNHTAGFVTDDPWADRQLARSHAELEGFLSRAEPFSHAPGQQFEYSNLGFVILGQIIEKTSGHSFASRLQVRIITQLGMKNTTLDFTSIPDEQRAQGYNWVDDSYVEEPVLGSGTFDPLGGVWTTADDYGKFVAWFLSAWPARNDPEANGIPRRVVRSVTDGVYLLGAGHRSGLDGEEDCQVAFGYSMGLGISRHCQAGLMLSHGGGFPGFSSYVILMPNTGIGVFAFTNRTYARVSGAVWDAAIKLNSSGIAAEPVAIEPDPRLQAAFQGVIKAFEASDISSAGVEFADNFFLDRSEERWNRQLTRLRQLAGSCDTAESLEPDGSLSGSFYWDCESARVAGWLIMSPVNPAEIQAMHLRVMRRDNRGRELNTDFDFH
jgi:D-alanyl-D-alanine-carboxypeptidase/D-alanyl-D-alanine-endopeptidase